MGHVRCLLLMPLSILIFISPANSEVESDIEREFRCRETCGFKHKYEMSWKGLMVCANWRGANKDPEPETECFFNCYGVQVPLRQHDCFCKYCKLKNEFFPPHKEFCASRGGPHIQEDQCDTHVCVGDSEASYRGYWCHPADPKHVEEAKRDWDLDRAQRIERNKEEKRCKDKSEYNEKSVRALWHGEHVCAYTEEGHFRPKMDSELYFECKGIKPAKNQRTCKCKYCKMHPDHTRQFCVKPGYEENIKPDECDEQVCSSTGKANYHGEYCNPYEKLTIDYALKNFGESKGK